MQTENLRKRCRVLMAKSGLSSRGGVKKLAELTGVGYQTLVHALSGVRHGEAHKTALETAMEKLNELKNV